MQGQAIATRKVTQQQHRAFAEFSGDWNPMHMDPAAARRTQAGAPVVHGIHSLLWALDTLAQPVSSLKVKLLKWIYLDDPAQLITSPSGFDIQIQGAPVLTAQQQFAAEVPDEVPMLPPSRKQAVAPDKTPRHLSLTEMVGQKGAAWVASDEVAIKAFPTLSKIIGPRAVAELAATSYIVGMQAPGLNSTYSKLEVTLHPDPTATGLNWEVASIDERFRKARIAIKGAAIHGTIEAFVRQPPAEQATMEEVAARIAPTEFKGMTALIIGGSRGLGELTAKIVAAGGGHPLITWATGLNDAENVATQIRNWGGQADTLPYDVRTPAEPQLTRLPAQPTHLFYFATNPIFQPRYQVFSAKVLEDFLSFYVQGFYDLCTALLKVTPTLRAWYPSSVAVEQRPPGMTEYAMAKAAGELLCQDMNLQLPGFNVSQTRLPRLPTDQTAGILPVRSLDPLDILIPIVRERMSRP